MRIKDFDAVVKVWDFTDDGESGTMNIQEAYKDETKPNGYRVEFQNKFTKVYGDAYEFMKCHSTPLFVKLHAGALKNRYNPEKNTTTFYLNIYSMEEATDEDFAPKGKRDSSNYGVKNGGNTATTSASGKAKKTTPAPANDDDNDLPF